MLRSRKGELSSGKDDEFYKFLYFYLYENYFNILTLRMGKTISEIYGGLSPGAFAIKNESWAENIYAIVYSVTGITEPMGVPVKNGIPQGLPRPIPGADKPEWILVNDNNIDLSKYVYWGLFSLDSIVITRTSRNTHFGKSIKEILHSDIGFIRWGIKNHHKFYLSDDVIDYIRKNNIGLSEELIDLNNQRRREELELGIKKHPHDFTPWKK